MIHVYTHHYRLAWPRALPYSKKWFMDNLFKLYQNEDGEQNVQEEAGGEGGGDGCCDGGSCDCSGGDGSCGDGSCGDGSCDNECCVFLLPFLLLIAFMYFVVRCLVPMVKYLIRLLIMWVTVVLATLILTISSVYSCLQFTVKTFVWLAVDIFLVWWVPCWQDCIDPNMAVYKIEDRSTRKMDEMPPNILRSDSQDYDSEHFDYMEAALLLVYRTFLVSIQDEECSNVPLASPAPPETAPLHQQTNDVETANTATFGTTNVEPAETEIVVSCSSNATSLQAGVTKGTCLPWSFGNNRNSYKGFGVGH